MNRRIKQGWVKDSGKDFSYILSVGSRREKRVITG